MRRDGVVSDALNRGRRRRRAEPAWVQGEALAEVRYVGQAYELQVELPEGEVTGETLRLCAERFHEAHRRVYGQSDPDGALELVSVRVRHRAALPAPERLRVPMGDGTPPGERMAYFDELGRRVPTPVWARSALVAGQRIAGPAIVEQADTTTVAYPGQELRVDDEGNLLLETGV
jgi:N-methylhydantoinase A